MIDIGLTKLALIGVVALVVIGPERLPKVARMAGTLFGRAQRYINDVKSEVSREMELDELRKMQKDVQDAASDVSNSIHKSMSETEASINDAWNGGDDSSSSDSASAGGSWTRTPDASLLAIKAKAFRRKKLSRTTGVPAWYKHQSGHKTRVISASARVAKYRRPVGTGKSAGFF
ncbi:preprotein translocase [Herbaspirillum rubrisubalbicans]|jgi:sec-independent protein translocase protein TatB|uniref:Sec-independent protein translocase protein TatB n=2 Tax=Herbaspirillum rubrisubalbicans TaxID=80842 RepID=A0AAD0UA87_9BURK|nr:MULTISPECIES: Sec-independent protein translocase protein TatB [Herbaspirillum]ALU91165.1 Sec-independent protein translocase protein [Herbaspirillum rubrisubalbicans M1]AYR26192.1 twin-arginine translocase subunit TatB [Herbaspirillum rubrisubalbicans]MCP1574590.1 sec-independent protein translocase protein TatB [Herbaspirillum rubrisubalbicans]NQE51037.1 preprotein translocase [Herbaspirillum rubrisubalbicans]QJQ03057.1 twin-arginine translocase subunit TatB [Herbaspirillum rubrisubalbica